MTTQDNSPATSLRRTAMSLKQKANDFEFERNRHIREADALAEQIEALNTHHAELIRAANQLEAAA